MRARALRVGLTPAEFNSPRSVTAAVIGTVPDDRFNPHCDAFLFVATPLHGSASLRHFAWRLSLVCLDCLCLGPFTLFGDVALDIKEANMRARMMRLGGPLAGVALLAAALLAQEHEGPHWGYSGGNRPDHWGALDKSFSTCQQGQHQSPIDIRAAKSSDLPPIQFGYGATPLHIVNNGHTIQVNYAPGSFITVGTTRYELKQFHFHHPSEEKIDGKGFAMVAHLVHAAADGSLAVVAVLMDAGSANPVITSVWQHLPAKEGPEQKLDSVQVDVSRLLPSNHGYYTFTGSLTTPPCTENVTWFVLKTPESISQAQVDAFSKIYRLNARPTQPLNRRELLASK
jgi:carbonic anhydrase